MVNDTLYITDKDTTEYIEIKLDNWNSNRGDVPTNTNILVTIVFILVGIAVMITRSKH